MQTIKANPRVKLTDLYRKYSNRPPPFQPLAGPPAANKSLSLEEQQQRIWQQYEIKLQLYDDLCEDQRQRQAEELEWALRQNKPGILDLILESHRKETLPDPPMPPLLPKPEESPLPERTPPEPGGRKPKPPGRNTPKSDGRKDRNQPPIEEDGRKQPPHDGFSQHHRPR
jgi:hypothetical protein